MGSVLYGQVEWNVDAEIVVRYRRAGLIPFGRSTSAELGLSHFRIAGLRRAHAESLEARS